MLSRRRIVRIMKGKGLISAYADAKFKPSRSSAEDADVREIVGHAAGERKDAGLVKSAFATLSSLWAT